MENDLQLFRVEVVFGNNNYSEVLLVVETSIEKVKEQVQLRKDELIQWIEGPTRFGLDLSQPGSVMVTTRT